MRALESVADEHPGVRKAASDVVVCAMERLGGGFGGGVARGLGAQLMAALSHVRMDVRVAGARLMRRVMELEGVKADVVFEREVGNPLVGLAEMLGGVEKVGGKIVVLEAIASACQRGRGDNGGRSKKDRTTQEKRRRFYYHGEKRGRLGGEIEGVGGLVRRLEKKEAIGLMVKCGFIACECLPVGEARRDKERGGLLIAAVGAMRGLGCDWTLQGEGVGIVRRVLGEWGGKGVERAEVGMAGLGVKCGLGEEVLKGVIGCEGVDEIVREYLEGGGERWIGLLWMRKFLERGERGEWGYVAGVVGVLRVVLEVMTMVEREDVLERVGRIGWGCMRGGKGSGALGIVVEWLKRGVGEECGQKVGRVFVEGVVEGGIGDEDEEVVGGGVFYGGVGLEERMLEGMIAQRVRSEGGTRGGGMEAGVRAAVESRREEGDDNVEDEEGVRLRAMAALDVAQRVPK